MNQFPTDEDPRDLADREAEEAKAQEQTFEGRWIDEPCRRCGKTVIGALDAKGFGVYLDSLELRPESFRNGMPFAGPGAKRHACAKVTP